MIRRSFCLLLASLTTASVHAFSSNSRPQLRPSSTLEECTFAGNIGFDPCQLANSRRTLWQYRESEIKHARLAMLASMLWLIVEQDAPWWYEDSDSYIAFLPLLQRVSPVWWGACVGLVALSEITTHERDEIMASIMPDNTNDARSYVPGQLGWDPLHLFPEDSKQQQNYLSQEIWSGRMAMLGMAVPLSQQGYDLLVE